MVNLAINSIFPEQAASQQAIQQRSALAQALLQQGMAGSGPTQYAAGGMAVKQNPLEGIAKLAQPLDRDFHSCSRKRTSFSKSERRSSMPWRSIASRSTPVPKA